MRGMMRLALLGVPGAQQGAGVPYLPRPLAVEPASLIGAYPLNRNAEDYSGNERHAVATDIVYGAPGMGDGGAFASFNGVSSLIALPAAARAAFDPAQGTMLVWVRGTDPLDNSGYIVIAYGNSGNYITVRFAVSGIQVAHRGASAAEKTINTPTVGNTLYCIVYSWDIAKDLHFVSVDGFNDHEIQTGLTAWNTSITKLEMGAYNSIYSFAEGEWGHVYLWNKALTINQHLDLGTPTPVSRQFYPVRYTKTYTAFGVALVFGTTPHIYTRRSTAHAPVPSYLEKWEPADTPLLWANSNVYDDEYDSRNVAGGVVPTTGTGLLFLGRYDLVGEAWHDMIYLRSVDNGNTWSEPTIILTSDTTFSPYGPLIELPSGNLLQSFYGYNSATLVYRVYTLLSSDDGLTWGNEVAIIAATSPRITETALCLLDGASDAAARLIAVGRDNNGALRQYKSPDGGASWSEVGVLPFSSGSNTDVSPWLYNDGGTIHLVYTDRITMEMKHATGTVDVFDDVNAWAAPHVIHTALAQSEGEYGYPSIVKVDGTLYLTFNDTKGGPAYPFMWWGKLE